MNFLPYIIIIGGLFYSQINFRDKVLDGSITYGKALGYGVMTGIFYSLIQTFYIIIFMKFIDPDVLQYIYDITEQNLIEQGLTTADIDKAMLMTKKMTFPMMLIGSIFGGALVSFIISLVTSIFVKKIDDPFSNDMKDIE